MNESNHPSRAGTGVDEPAWLIWSNEHGAWWHPDECGYTRVFEEAGRYTRAEADAIVETASIAIKPGGRPNEVAVFATGRHGAGIERSMTDEIVYFSALDDEALTATTIAEAVIEFCERHCHIDGNQFDPDQEIEITSYRHMPLPNKGRIVDTIIDALINYLEEYFDPNASTCELPGEVVSAAYVVADAVHDHFKPWACEAVRTDSVCVRDFLSAEDIAEFEGLAQTDRQERP